MTTSAADFFSFLCMLDRDAAAVVDDRDRVVDVDDDVDVVAVAGQGLVDALSTTS